MPEVIDYLPMGDDEDSENLIIILPPFDDPEVEIAGSIHTASVYPAIDTFWSEVWNWNVSRNRDDEKLWDQDAPAPTRECAIFCAKVSLSLVDLRLKQEQLLAWVTSAKSLS